MCILGIFFFMVPRPTGATRTDTRFPDATLFRSSVARTVSTPYWQRPGGVLAFGLYLSLASVILLVLLSVSRNLVRFERLARSISVGREGHRDRKSTRLNSSH